MLPYKGILYPCRVHNLQVDKAANSAMVNLRQTVESSVSPNNIFDFNIEWAEPAGIDSKVHKDYLISFGNTLFEQVSTTPFHLHNISILSFSAYRNTNKIILFIIVGFELLNKPLRKRVWVCLENINSCHFKFITLYKKNHNLISCGRDCTIKQTTLNACSYIF